MQIKNIDGKLYTMQACYVNFNPKIYNGNIHVFFYNLVNLNKRILCEGDGKLKIGGGLDFLPGYLSSLIFHSFFKIVYIIEAVILFLYLKKTFWTPPPKKRTFWTTPPPQQKKICLPAVGN